VNAPFTSTARMTIRTPPLIHSNGQSQLMSPSLYTWITGMVRKPWGLRSGITGGRCPSCRQYLSVSLLRVQGSSTKNISPQERYHCTGMTETDRAHTSFLSVHRTSVRPVSPDPTADLVKSALQESTKCRQVLPNVPHARSTQSRWRAAPP